MYRRRVLAGSGSIFAAVAGVTVPNIDAIQDETDSEQPESETIEFDGEGVTVTDEFEIDSGPTVIEGTHDGESDFFVRAVPREEGGDQSLINHFGAYEGSTGAFIEEGTYVIYVDADGSWELSIRQPRVSEDEATEPPVSIEGTGPDWTEPILFDETTRIAGRYDGTGNFHVEVVPQDDEDSEYLWNGGELVFHALGTFGGITSTHVDGIGYIDVEVDDERAQWMLEIE